MAQRWRSATRTAPPGAGSQTSKVAGRVALRRPVTSTSTRRELKRPSPSPIPCHVDVVTDKSSSGAIGQRSAASVTTTRATRRSCARAISRRAAACGTLAGGRRTMSSTPSKSSPAASAHPACGCGTNTARRRSRPSSAMAATPGSASPTAAHQWPREEASASRLTPSEVAPVPGRPATTVVVPRRSDPPGTSGASASLTGIVLAEAGTTGAICWRSPAGTGGRDRGVA